VRDREEGSSEDGRGREGATSPALKLGTKQDVGFISFPSSARRRWLLACRSHERKTGRRGDERKGNTAEGLEFSFFPPNISLFDPSR